MDTPLDPLFQFFGPMTKEEHALIADSVHTMHVAKGGTLLEVGAVGDTMFLVASGGLRTFFLDQNGNDVTRYLALPNQVCTVLDSFISRKPSEEAIDAFADSELIVWDRAAHDRLMWQVPAWSKAYTRQLEEALVINAWRVSILLGLDAAQRYVALIRDWPALVRDVPDRIIASYIGIAPEYLSRLKSRMLRVGT